MALVHEQNLAQAVNAEAKNLNISTLPEPRDVLIAELESSLLLREINPTISVYQVDGLRCKTVMREIGRLREIAFQMVGEGTGQVRDIDSYDDYYKQIVLWNTEEQAIIGGYRVAIAGDVLREKGIKGLYNHRLFQFHEKAMPKLERGVELGRSFINPEHWGRRNLDYLWMGIGSFLSHNPDVQYLFGAVSISDDFPRTAKLAIANFYQAYFGVKESLATPRNVFRLSRHNPYTGKDYSEEFRHLKAVVGSYGVSIPPLYKHYSELAEMNGVSVLGFNVDACFGNCVDGLMIVDREKIKPKKAARYIPIK